MTPCSDHFPMGDSDYCTIFLIICTELKSFCLGATEGKSVSLLPLRQSCLCGKVLTVFRLSLSPVSMHLG